MVSVTCKLVLCICCTNADNNITGKKVHLRGNSQSRGYRASRTDILWEKTEYITDIFTMLKVTFDASCDCTLCLNHNQFVIHTNCRREFYIEIPHAASSVIHLPVPNNPLQQPNKTVMVITIIITVGFS